LTRWTEIFGNFSCWTPVGFARFLGLDLGRLSMLDDFFFFL